MSAQPAVEKKYFKTRVASARDLLRRLGADALVVTDLKNIRYLSGFTGSNALCVITGGRSYFLTDSRYAGQVESEVSGFKVRILNNLLDGLNDIIGVAKVGSIAIEDSISYGLYKRIKGRLAGVDIKDTPEGVNFLRRVKDQFEIDLMRRAAELLDAGFKRIEGLLRPGAVESEVAWEIESFFRSSGAQGLAFDTIIASGPRGAMPHGNASDKKIKRGEMVVVDMGAVLDGYNSDETRTYCIGTPSRLQSKVYDIVKCAQEKALAIVRPGVRAAAVDIAARRHIRRAGYGDYFGHGTGHGVGLDIHELPSLSPKSKDVLLPGMVVTVEPGVYLPGRFGVRIEDSVVVVKGGFEYLTKTEKKLLAL